MSALTLGRIEFGPGKTAEQRVEDLSAQLHLLSTEARVLREQVGILREAVSDIRRIAAAHGLRTHERIVERADSALRVTA